MCFAGEKRFTVVMQVRRIAVMNRREVLESAVAALPLSLSKPSVAVACEEHAKPLVIVFTSERMTDESLAVMKHRLEKDCKEIDVRFLVVPSCDGVVIAPVPGSAKYGFTEKLGDYSLSVFCQTAEEMDEWMPNSRLKQVEADFERGVMSVNEYRQEAGRLQREGTD